MNTFFGLIFLLRNSPKNGSPKESESISGHTNSGYSLSVRKTIPTANPPQANALICLDS